MNQRVHLLADELGRRPVAEHPRARRVAERAHAAEVDAVNGFGRRVEQQTDAFFALGDLLPRTDELGDVARNAGYTHESVGCVEDRREGHRDVDDSAVLAQTPRFESLDRPPVAYLAEDRLDL